MNTQDWGHDRKVRKDEQVMSSLCAGSGWVGCFVQL